MCKIADHKKHLYVSDMDGTLLGTDSRVSEESAAIITALSERGIPVTVATARTPATVDVLLKDTLTIVPAIVMTGAALWDRERRRYINPVFLDNAVAAEVKRVFDAAGVDPFIYALDGSEKLTVFHGRGMNRQEDRFYQERRHLAGKRFVLGEGDGLAAYGCGTILMFAVGEAKRIEAVAGQLRKIGGVSVSCYRDIFNPDIANIEVFGPDVSKAKAIRWLADHIGAEMVTVYGDNLNDLPMFEVADESVAVANAMPEVIERADRVIGRNGDSAVAKDILAQTRQ